MAASTPPEFHEQVQIDATVGQHNFETGFANASLNPTMLGEFGSRIAIEASTALAQKRGLEAGMDPHGTLLPPITSADKAYQDAYVAQANNTLSMQASKMMLDGEMELSKAYKLTPDAIAAYSKNMAEGINKIINTAPMQAQPGLQAQFGSSLMRTTAQYNQKMIGQQKEEAIQNADINSANQLASIFDAGRAGQIGAAKSILKAYNQTNQQMHDSGMISAKEADANAKSARISYYSGNYSAEALDASKHKDVDQYLSDLVNRPAPDGIHQEEWESITKNVVNEVARREAFNQRNQTSLMSEANRLLAENGLTPGFIAKLETQMDKAPFNNFMASVAYQQRAKQKDTSAVDELTANWTQPISMGTAKSQVLDATFANVVQAVKDRANNSGRPIDDFEAQTQAMSTAGGPVPVFTKIINSGLTSGNAQLMQQTGQAYRSLLNSNPKVIQDISKQGQAMLTAFENQMISGVAPDVAALNARNIVMQKTEQQLQINDQLTANWEKQTVNSPAKLVSWSAQFADMANGERMSDPDGFALQAKSIFKENMNLLNGDIESATQMTKEGLSRSWGITDIGGKPEFLYQPIEKVLGLHGDASVVPIVRHELYNQIKDQAEEMNGLWALGEKSGDQRMTFYYNIPKRPGFDDYMGAKKFVNKHPTFLNNADAAKLRESRDIIKQFENQEVVVEKVYKNKHVEKFFASIAADPGLQIGPNGVLGKYNVVLKQANGRTTTMNGYFNGHDSSPIFRPNINKIRSRYFDAVGINASRHLTGQQENAFRVSRNEAEAKKSYNLVNWGD